jgi:methionine-rich copper-binding protein CopC
VSARRTRLLVTAVFLAAGTALIAVVAGGPDPAVRLVSASPADNARLSGPPREVSLVFSGPVEAARSHLTVAGADGRPVPAGPLSVRDEVMTRPVTLAPGTGYRVAYHAVLPGDQQVSGEVNFGVGVNAPAPAAAGGHQHADVTGSDLALLAIDAVLIAVVLTLILRGPRVRPNREPNRWSSPNL